MAKYLLVASYNAEGAKGVLKDGGEARRDAATKAVESLGGEVESFYFGFGSDDAYVVVDLPDNASAAATSLVVSASGAVSSRIIVLLSPSEIDKAAEKAKTAQYVAPGR